MRRHIVVVFALSLFASVQTVHADMYQDQITKSFPGFVIMNQSEFKSEIQKTLKTNPALIVGRFNRDKIDDFAALIRGTTKKRYEAGEHSYDYYDSKLVVCHGLGNRKYDCEELIKRGIAILPEYRFLIKHAPGRINCDVHGDDYRDIDTDSIGYNLESASGQYIYQPDGSYMECTTAD